MDEQGLRSPFSMGPAVGRFVASFSISYQGGGVSVVKVSSSGSSRNFRHGPCSKTRYKAFEGDHDQTSDNATNLLNLHV